MMKTLHEAWNKALQYHRSGKLHEAELAYRQILKQTPNSVQLLHILARVCYEQKKPEDSRELLQQACNLAPDNMDLHYSLATLQAQLGQFQAAGAEYKSILKHEPNQVDALIGLGSIHYQYMRYSEAIACLDKALMINDENALAHYNLGLALVKIGETLEALEHFRQARSINPELSEAQDCQLFILHNIPDITDQQLYEAHVNWARHHAPEPTAITGKIPARRHKNQKMRVGYVSPDFRRHSVSYFIKPVIEKHDRSRIECYCYSHVEKPDATTDSIRKSADHWRDISQLSDEQAVNAIRQDGIDILVDLSGHTTRNRLLIFAQQPAPVQVSWIGYPGTTGLPAIDYRITDNRADPEGESDPYYTEKLVRLEPCFLCYEPPANSPPTAPSPVQLNDYITFGSFNNLSKYSGQMISIWAKILTNIPDSKLLLKAEGIGDKAGRERVYNAFSDCGIGPERLETSHYIDNLQEHLELYNRIDIALDTFPYNGATTTCEALWMGVPVITLAGNRHAARVGLSLLSAAGLPEFAVRSVEDYIILACNTACNRDSLSCLRKIMREKLLASDLMNKSRIVANLEEAYGRMLD